MKTLNPEAATLISNSIGYHVQTANVCRAQAAQLHSILTASGALPRMGVAEGTRVRATIATVELEIATHAAALTTIACTLARLEADGFDVLSIMAKLAEFREAQPEPGAKPH